MRPFFGSGLPRKIFGGRDALLLLDTGVSSVQGLGLMVLASRYLAPEGLATFSLAQILLITMITLMRGSIYSPALAAQRFTGQRRIPTVWLLTLAVPLGLIVSVGASFLMADSHISALRWFTYLAAAGSAILVQDGLRAVLMSRNDTFGALASDVATVVVIAGVWVLGAMPDTPLGMLYLWGCSSFIGILPALLMLWSGDRESLFPPQALRDTWRLGRWAAVDNGLASAATMLPMFISALYVGSTDAGAYRALQSAMGPMNILHATLVTSFGLDAWMITNLNALMALKNRVRKMTTMLFAVSAIYSVIALPTMAFISHLQDRDLLRIALLVGYAGVLGAANTAFNAAALAMGFQRSGAVIRLVIVIMTLAISLPWSVNRWVPWHDPIGTSSLMVATVTFMGWWISYELGVRKEADLLAKADANVDRE